MIVRDLVSANAKGFLKGLLYWWLLAIPSTYTNSMIRYLQQKLSISFRTRLTRCKLLRQELINSVMLTDSLHKTFMIYTFRHHATTIRS